MRPIVTIGICVKNCETSIKEAISSIVDQDFPHDQMEVVLVDESEDRTLSVILTAISAIDIPTKVFHTTGKGLGRSRNKVIKNASGDYIIWVDSDMKISRDFVRKQVEFMEKNPKVGIAQGSFGATDSQNLVAYLDNVSWQVGDRLNRKKLPGTGGSIYRAKAIGQVGGFDNRFVGAGEDIEAAYRIRAAGWGISKTQSLFYETRRTTWKALWAEKIWKGSGLHQNFHKHWNIDKKYEMLPPFGFLAGFLYSLVAYQLDGQKKVFLLPLHSVFVKTALCFGFIKGHFDSNAHSTN